MRLCDLNTTFRQTIRVWVAFAAIVLAPLAAHAVTLSLLPVGDPGNAIDPRPFANVGAVPYRPPAASIRAPSRRQVPQ